MKCDHVDITPLHRSIRIGGFGGMGQCQNDALPGFVVCFEHVSKDALWFRVQQLEKKQKRRKS